ncbi:hypothetical protein [Streptosporangium amethystogenes]|uniref:hypothetical protein n=1 Tax=Streptosporangium amethystogenes TaxID=2002 RepID=UPI00068ED811|nr:hypothetical protein [Streptosporangium amethystogenes]
MTVLSVLECVRARAVSSLVRSSSSSAVTLAGATGSAGACGARRPGSSKPSSGGAGAGSWPEYSANSSAASSGVDQPSSRM